MRAAGFVVGEYPACSTFSNTIGCPSTTARRESLEEGRPRTDRGGGSSGHSRRECHPGRSITRPSERPSQAVGRRERPRSNSPFGETPDGQSTCRREGTAPAAIECIPSGSRRPCPGCPVCSNANAFPPPSRIHPRLPPHTTRCRRAVTRRLQMTIAALRCMSRDKDRDSRPSWRPPVEGRWQEKPGPRPHERVASNPVGSVRYGTAEGMKSSLHPSSAGWREPPCVIDLDYYNQGRAW